MHDDQHQPAADSARIQPLTDPDITVLQQQHRRYQASENDAWCKAAGCKQEWPCETTRLLADLARARAEAAALKKALGKARVGIEATADVKRRARLPEARHWQALLGEINTALAAPQSEQLAAPVDRSAEAEGPETVRCHVCDVEIAAICDDCLKLVHDRMHELLDTTPPDHQAGDEP